MFHWFFTIKHYKSKRYSTHTSTSVDSDVNHFTKLYNKHNAEENIL